MLTQVEGTLFRISRNLLLQGQYFCGMFEDTKLPENARMEGTSDSYPIVPQGISSADLSSLLMILNARYAPTILDCKSYNKDHLKTHRRAAFPYTRAAWRSTAFVHNVGI